VKKKINISIFLVLIVIILIRGYFALHDPAKHALEDKIGRVIILEGTITKPPEKKDFSQIFVLEADDGMSFRVGANKFGEYEYGDRVKVAGKLSAPRNFSSNGGRVFNYIDYLGKDGI
jgi:hypothetical protein